MKPEIKRKILIVIWCLLATIVLAVTGWFVYRWTQFLTYTDQQHHFSLKYPKAWDKVEGLQGTAIVFVRPKQTALDTFEPNVNITVQEVPDRIATLEDFSKTIIQQMAAIYKDMNIVESRKYSLARRKGYRMVLEAPKPDNLKVMFVWSIKGSLVYIFTFMAKAEQYKDLSLTMDEMLNSFQFN